MKLITKIVGATLGLAMAVGVGFAVASNNQKATMLDAAAATSSASAPTNANYSYTFASGDLPVAGATKTFGGISWTYSGDTHGNNTYVGFDSTKGVQLGKGTAEYGATTDMTLTASVASFGNNKRVTKMAIGLACASSGGYSGSFSNGDTISSSTTSVLYWSSSAMNVTSGNIVFTFKSTVSNKAIYVKAIYVWHEDSGSSATQLDAPAPIYSDGYVTWDDVENASSYDLSVDGGAAIHNAESPYSVSGLATPAVHTVNVTAIGDGENYSDSPAGSVTFALLNNAGTNVDPYDVANARIAIDGEATVDDVYVTGIVSRVDSFDGSSSSITYWISDDGTTTNQFEVYKGKGISGANFTSINDVEVGASVVVFGDIKKYNTTYEFNANSELVSYDVRSVFENKQTFSSLTYHYSKTETETFNDELNRALTDVSGTSYLDWDDKTVNSGVVYKGNSAGGNDSIQLRTDKNTSGIVTTTSSKIAKSLTVTWDSHTDNARILQVFGKNTAYSAATDLYDDNNKGDLVAELAIANSDANKTLTYEFETTYKYLGFKSKSGAQYVASIEIEWSDMTINYTSATLRFGAMVSASSWSKLENVVGYGVMISYEDLGVYSIEELYRDAKTNENTIDQAIDDLFDVDGLETDDDGVVEGKSFYQPLSGKAEGHPDSANAAQKTDFGVEGDYYIWYLNKNVAGKLGIEYTAVAYIRTTTDLIFLQDSVASAKSVAAQKLETAGNNAAGGSLKYLAEIA